MILCTALTTKSSAVPHNGEMATVAGWSRVTTDFERTKTHMLRVLTRDMRIQCARKEPWMCATSQTDDDSIVTITIPCFE
jgi:hypothetical protein